MSRIRNICIIGAGQVGGPLAAIIAAKNEDTKVQVVDIHQDRIKQWQTNKLPVKEPYLLSLVQQGRDAADGRRLRNLVFSTNIEQAIQDAEMIFIASRPILPPTRTVNEDGRPHMRMIMIQHLSEILTMIASNSTTYKIIVIKSTLSGGAAKEIQHTLSLHWPREVKVDILYNPEFCAEGETISDLLNPDRIIIGSSVRGRQAAALLRSVYSWVLDHRFVFMDIQSAELAKLAANTMLAQRISNVNAISAICEEIGADVEMVSHACGLDHRIGPHALKASPGFGGSCLKKDIAILAGFSESLGLDQIGCYWKSINVINEAHKIRFTHNVIRDMWAKNVDPKLGEQVVAVLGCAFKKNTSDVRNSAAISMMEKLLEHGYHLRTYDPQISPLRLLENIDWAKDEYQPYLNSENLTFWNSALEACKDASAVIIATDWDEFSNRRTSHASDAKEIHDDELRLKLLGITKDKEPPVKKVDWFQISKVMRDPKLMFDGHNIVDALTLTAFGFDVYQKGKPGFHSNRGNGGGVRDESQTG